MATGTVEGFEATEGSGSVRPDNGDKDVFVRISAVGRAGLPSLGEGRTITCGLVADRRSGKMAADDLEAVQPRGADAARPGRTSGGAPTGPFARRPRSA